VLAGQKCPSAERVSLNLDIEIALYARPHSRAYVLRSYNATQELGGHLKFPCELIDSGLAVVPVILFYLYPMSADVLLASP
jgi:hypothetical protein